MSDADRRAVARRWASAGDAGDLERLEAAASRSGDFEALAELRRPTLLRLAAALRSAAEQASDPGQVPAPCCGRPVWTSTYAHPTLHAGSWVSTTVVTCPGADPPPASAHVFSPPGRCRPRWSIDVEWDLHRPEPIPAHVLRLLVSSAALRAEEEDRHGLGPMRVLGRNLSSAPWRDPGPPDPLSVPLRYRNLGPR